MLQSVLIPELSIFPVPSLPVFSTNENVARNAATKSDELTSTVFCCQTLKTAEKMTQVNFGQIDDENLGQHNDQLQQLDRVDERRRSDFDEKVNFYSLYNQKINYRCL